MHPVCHFTNIKFYSATYINIIQVIKPDAVRSTLALMQSCGMYDSAGEFTYSVSTYKFYVDLETSVLARNLYPGVVHGWLCLHFIYTTPLRCWDPVSNYSALMKQMKI